MRRKTKLRSIFFIMSAIVFMFIGNTSIRAIEETPKHCFKYSSLKVGPIVDNCKTECFDDDKGGKVCHNSCEMSTAVFTSIITEYLCYEGNAMGYETITDVVIPRYLEEDLDSSKDLDLIYNIEISPNVFENKNLTSLVISDTVKAIGEKSFYNNKLTNLTIPINVQKIGNLAFANNDIKTVINKSNISNDLLKNNTGNSDTKQLIFGTDCKQISDDVIACNGDDNIAITNGEIVNNPIIDNENKEQDDIQSSDENLDNDKSLENPKTLDINNTKYIIVILCSIIVLVTLLLSISKKKRCSR